MKHNMLFLILALFVFTTLKSQNTNVQIDIQILGYDGISEFQYFLDTENNSNTPIKVQPDKNGKITIRKNIHGLQYFFFHFSNKGDNNHYHRCKMIVEPDKHYTIISQGEEDEWPRPKGYYYSPDIYSWSKNTNDAFYSLNMDYNQMYYNMFDDNTLGCLYADDWDLQQPDSLIYCLNKRISNRLSIYSEQYNEGKISSEYFAVMKANIEYLLAYQLAQTIICTKTMNQYRIDDEMLSKRLNDVLDTIFSLFTVENNNLRHFNVHYRYVDAYLYNYASKKSSSDNVKIRNHSKYIDEIKPVLNPQVYKGYKMQNTLGMVGGLILGSSYNAEKFLKEYPEMKASQWGILLENELIPRLNKFDSLANRLPSDAINYLDDHNALNTFNELTDRFKGKPFLIDIWGTWCGPCRNMFQFKDSLNSFLKQNNIEMVYAAYEYSNDREQWKKIIRAYDLAGHHLIMTDKLRKEIEAIAGKIIRFPTYMIVNEQGLIVENQAHLPSEGNKLQEQIMMMLNK